VNSSSSSQGVYRPQPARSKASRLKLSASKQFNEARSEDAGTDLTPRQTKHHRPVPSSRVRTLAPRHVPPTRTAPDKAAQMVQWSRNHRDFLLGTTFQGGALAAVGGGATGAIAGLVSNVSGGVPFGPFFNAVACAASFADIYGAQVNANRARKAYLQAHVLLAEQHHLLEALDARLQGGPPLPEDASFRDLANSLIQQFEGFIQSYEQAFFKDAGAVHVRRASAALQAQARELVALKGEYDQWGDEILRLQTQLDALPTDDLQRASIASALSALHRQRDHQWTRAQDLRASMKARLSPEKMKKDLAARLAQARDELRQEEHEALGREPSDGADVAQPIQSLRQEIQALEDDLGRLDNWPRRVVLTPFGDSGPAELARVRDATLGSLKLLMDLGATGNSMAAVFGAAIFSSINLMLPAWALDLVSGRIDVKGGKRGMAAAAAAKLPVLDQGTHAAALCEAYGQLEDPNARACQYPLLAMVRSASHQLSFLHKTSEFNKARKLHGLKSIVNALLLMSTGVATLLTGVPVVVGPAVAGGAASVKYVHSAIGYLVNAGADKNDRKQDEALALAFVRLFGPQAPGEFYRDMAEGHAHRWDKRLEMLRQHLRATPDGRDLDPKLLHPHALASNPWLAIEFLSQALYVRARDHGIGTPTIESDLVARLAEALGKADPGAWDLQNFPSPELYLQQVRRALSDLYGLQADPEDHLPFRDPRPLSDIAASVNGLLEWHLSHKNALPLNDRNDPSKTKTVTFAAWIHGLANHPKDVGDELKPEGLQRVKEQLDFLRRKLREQGIGPRELYALQALSVQPPGNDGQHPLQHAPQLRSAAAPYLLELLADPSWLDTPAATAPPDALPAAGTDGTRAVGHLTKAMKGVGRSRRDGPPVRRRTPEDGQAAAEPRHVRLRRWVAQRPAAINKHIQQQRANPLGTPDKAIQELRRLERKNDPTELHVLMHQLLVAFAREVGGPGLVLPQDPDVMDRLPATATEAEVKQAHLLALLASALQAAKVTAACIPKHPAGRARDSDSQKRLRDRMADTSLLCSELARLMEVNKSVTAILAPIEVR